MKSGKIKYQIAKCDLWDDPRIGEFSSHIVKMSVGIADTCNIDPSEFLEALATAILRTKAVNETLKSVYDDLSYD